MLKGKAVEVFIQSWLHDCEREIEEEEKEKVEKEAEAEGEENEEEKLVGKEEIKVVRS